MQFRSEEAPFAILAGWPGPECCEDFRASCILDNSSRLACRTFARHPREVRPRYTTDAVRRKVQGTVVMEVVVTSEGCPSQIRIVKSLDRGGLDDEAVSAVTRWQFEPGRRGDVPVDVLVVIELTVSLR